MSIRRIAGLLIALCLVLPERSCMQNGVTQIIYPTSGADTLGEMLLVLALYLIPLAITLTGRFRVALLSVGVSISVLGLYAKGYAGWVFSTSVLVGWYVNTVATAAYLLASIIELWRSSRSIATTVLLASVGGVLGSAWDMKGMALGAAAGVLVGLAISGASRWVRPANC